MLIKTKNSSVADGLDKGSVLWNVAEDALLKAELVVSGQ
jgi:hypothetical protein